VKDIAHSEIRFPAAFRMGMVGFAGRIPGLKLALPVLG
jgi:hypothetical protein